MKISKIAILLTVLFYSFVTPASFGGGIEWASIQSTMEATGNVAVHNVPGWREKIAAIELYTSVLRDGLPMPENADISNPYIEALGLWLNCITNDCPEVEFKDIYSASAFLLFADHVSSDNLSHYLTVSFNSISAIDADRLIDHIDNQDYNVIVPIRDIIGNTSTIPAAESPSITSEKVILQYFLSAVVGLLNVAEKSGAQSEITDFVVNTLNENNALYTFVSKLNSIDAYNMESRMIYDALVRALPDDLKMKSQQTAYFRIGQTLPDGIPTALPNDKTDFSLRHFSEQLLYKPTSLAPTHFDDTIVAERVLHYLTILDLIE